MTAISQEVRNLVDKIVNLAKQNTHYEAYKALLNLNNKFLDTESLASYLSMKVYQEDMAIHCLLFKIYSFKQREDFKQEDLLFTIYLPLEAQKALEKEFTSFSQVIVFANLAFKIEKENWTAYRLSPNVKDGTYTYNNFGHRFIPSNKDYFKRFPKSVKQIITNYISLNKDYWE